MSVRAATTDLIFRELRTPDEIREAVYLSGDEAATKQSRFWLLLVLSAVIATTGVLSDSTATVIGAMIVAPLATPIQGVAVAIVYGEADALLRSLITLLLAIGAVIALAAGIYALLPQFGDLATNSQVTGRIAPTIIDLVAALATGLAGMLAIARRDIGDILPGVAIAISLVPPLCVVGVMAAAGDGDAAFGALLLFTTNVLAIIVAGIIVAGATRLKTTEGEQAQRVRPAMVLVVVATLGVTAALSGATYRTVQLETQLSAARAVAEPWAQGHDEQLVDARFDGTSLVLVLEGLSDGTQDRELPRLLADAVPAGTEIITNRVVGSQQTVGTVE